MLFEACDCAAATNKIVFVTSAIYSGDLVTASGASSGLAAADRLCTNAGTGANLGTSWKAWISDSTTNAIDRINDVGPWYLTSGARAFNNKANLTTTPLTNVAFDENGQVVNAFDGSYHHYVWTGTQTGGIKTTLTCTDWTSMDDIAEGTVGALDDTTAWTGAMGSALDCSGATYRMHLYCLQQ